jgi:hypothetical protein
LVARLKGDKGFPDNDESVAAVQRKIGTTA